MADLVEPGKRRDLFGLSYFEDRMRRVPVADLVEWLTAQLDADERMALSSRGVAANRTHYRASLIDSIDQDLRTIAAHRAILDSYRTEAVCESDAAVVLESALHAIAAIYQDRPGFDPSWTADA